MCPFRAGYKISATRGKIHTVLHMLRISVPSAYSGERLRSSISLASELRDGKRDCVLALKIQEYSIHHSSFIISNWQGASLMSLKSLSSLIFFAPLHCQGIFRKHWQGTGCNPVVCFVSGRVSSSLGRLSHMSHVSDVSHTFRLPLSHE